MKKVSGSMLFQFKKYLLEKHGSEVYDRIIHLIPDEKAKEQLSGAILSNQWYDFDFDLYLVEAVGRELGRDELKQMVYYASDKLTSGFFGWILKFVPLRTIAENTNKHCKKLWIEGEMNCKEFLPEKIILDLKDCEAPDIFHITALFWIERLISQAQGKQYVGSFVRQSPKMTEYTFSYKA